MLLNRPVSEILQERLGRFRPFRHVVEAPLHSRRWATFFTACAMIALALGL